MSSTSAGIAAVHIEEALVWDSSKGLVTFALLALRRPLREGGRPTGAARDGGKHACQQRCREGVSAPSRPLAAVHERMQGRLDAEVTKRAEVMGEQGSACREGRGQHRSGGGRPGGHVRSVMRVIVSLDTSAP